MYVGGRNLFGYLRRVLNESFYECRWKNMAKEAKLPKITVNIFNVYCKNIQNNTHYQIIFLKI